MGNKTGLGGLVLLIICLVLFLGMHHLYLSLNLILIGGVFLLFFIRFEKRRVKARELVLLAVLGAIAAVSRIPFAGIPSVQPTTFVIIVTGLSFGFETGFVVGCLAAFVSNLFLGQGPWTPFQMVAWGLIGGGAGVLSRIKGSERLWVRCLYGGITGYLFGWIMNIWSLLSLHLSTFKEWLALYSSSFFFDSAHALSNVILLGVFGNSWIKILNRFKKKYGLLEQKR